MMRTSCRLCHLTPPPRFCAILLPIERNVNLFIPFRAAEPEVPDFDRACPPAEFSPGNQAFGRSVASTHPTKAANPIIVTTLAATPTTTSRGHRGGRSPTMTPTTAPTT